LAVVFVMLSMLAILVYAPFWLLGGIGRRRRRPAERAMRFWPLIAVLGLITMVGVVIVSGDDFIERMGNLTGWSLTVFLSTLLFGVASIASIVVVALRSSRRSSPRRATIFSDRVDRSADSNRVSRLLGYHRCAHLGIRERLPQSELR
jgi:hypothetical protein